MLPMTPLRPRVFRSLTPLLTSMQFESMIAGLTAREMVSFSAALRLPQGTCASQVGPSALVFLHTDVLHGTRVINNLELSCWIVTPVDRSRRLWTLP